MIGNMIKTIKLFAFIACFGYIFAYRFMPSNPPAWAIYFVWLMVILALIHAEGISK